MREGGVAPEAQNAEVAADVGEERVVVAVAVGQLDGLADALSGKLFDIVELVVDDRANGRVVMCSCS